MACKSVAATGNSVQHIPSYKQKQNVDCSNPTGSNKHRIWTSALGKIQVKFINNPRCSMNLWLQLLRSRVTIAYNCQITKNYTFFLIFWLLFQPRDYQKIISTNVLQLWGEDILRPSLGGLFWWKPKPIPDLWHLAVLGDLSWSCLDRQRPEGKQITNMNHTQHLPTTNHRH